MLKKIILAAAVAVSAVFAQSPVNVGGRAAVDMGTFWGNDVADAKWGLGFNAGVAAKMDFLPIISVVSGLEVDLRRVSDERTITQRGTEIKEESSLSMWYLDIPVMARFNLIPMFHADFGFVVGLNLAAIKNIDRSATVLGRTVEESESVSVSEEVATFDAGLIAGLGVSVIPGKLDVDFRILLGLTSFDKPEEGDAADVKHMRLQLGATYWFL